MTLAGVFAAEFRRTEACLEDGLPRRRSTPKSCASPNDLSDRPWTGGLERSRRDPLPYGPRPRERPRAPRSVGRRHAVPAHHDRQRAHADLLRAFAEPRWT